MNMLRNMSRLRLTALLFCGFATSCFSADPPSISSESPERLIPAIKHGVAANDHSIIPYLVKDLESEDAAIRFYSIDGLRRLTGQDLGYVYFDDEDKRKPAVDRWKVWLTQHPT